MAKGVNKVILVGNLGVDPEIRYLPSGTAVANLSLATGELRRDKETKELVEDTEWHRVVLFGKPAEIAGQYLKKGSQAAIVGKNKTRKYKDKAGSDRYVTEVIGAELTLIGSKAKSEDAAHDATAAEYETAFEKEE